MAINIGDATLSVLIDLSSTEAALARLNTEIPAKLKASGDEAVKLALGFDAVGKAASTAGNQATSAGDKIATAGKSGAKGIDGTNDAVQQLIARTKALEAEVLQLQAKITQFGQEAETAGNRAGRGFNHAAGEAGLLGEATGIRLPRHVRTFLAELPGISTLLNAAFSATAVFFLIEAVIKAGEKLQEFLEHQKKVEEAWRAVADAEAEVGRTAEKGLSQAEAKIIGFTQGPLAELDFQLKHIRQDAHEAAQAVGSIGGEVTKALIEQQASQWNPLSWWNDSSRDVAKEATEFFGKLKSDITQLGSQGGLVTLKSQIETVTYEIKKTNEELAKESTRPGKALFEDRLGALNKYRESLQITEKALEDFHQTEVVNAKNEANDARAQAGAKLAEQAKRDLDTQLAGIEKLKAAQHLFYSEGKINAADWSVAQRRAADDAIEAQNQYRDKLAEISKGFLGAARAQAVVQESVTEKTRLQNIVIDALAESIDKYRQGVQKLREEWLRAEFSNVGKDFKAAAVAAEELTRSEQRLGEAQKNLNQAISSRNYDEHIRKVELLATLGVISEEQKTAQLKAIYQQQEQDQLDSLNKLLAQEQTAIDVAQARVDNAKGNPFFTDAQLADLQKNLDYALTVYTKTETEIVNATAKSDARIGALDQSLISKASSSWNNYFKLLIGGSLKAGQAMKIMGGMFTDAIGASVSAAVMGSDSFAGAMAKVLKSALAALAGEAIVQAIKEIAWAFSDLATPFYEWHAATHFLAAAKWGAVGAAAAVVGVAIPTGGGSSAGATAGTSTGIDSSLPSNRPEQQPVQVVNVPHLQKGGLVDRETLALVHPREVVIPLDDSRARGAIAELTNQGGGEVHHHYNYNFNIKDLVTADGLAKFTQKVTKEIKRGTVRLSSNESFRVTRRG